MRWRIASPVSFLGVVVVDLLVVVVRFVVVAGCGPTGAGVVGPPGPGPGLSGPSVPSVPPGVGLLFPGGDSVVGETLEPTNGLAVPAGPTLGSSEPPE